MAALSMLLQHSCKERYLTKEKGAPIGERIA